MNSYCSSALSSFFIPSVCYLRNQSPTHSNCLPQNNLYFFVNDYRSLHNTRSPFARDKVTTSKIQTLSSHRKHWLYISTHKLYQLLNEPSAFPCAPAGRGKVPLKSTRSPTSGVHAVSQQHGGHSKATRRWRVATMTTRHCCPSELSQWKRTDWGWKGSVGLDVVASVGWVAGCQRRLHSSVDQLLWRLGTRDLSIVSYSLIGLCLSVRVSEVEWK